MFSWLLQYIWKSRNEKCFNAKDVSALGTLQLACEEAEAWKLAQLGEELEEPDIGRTERRREENPRDGVGQWRCQIDAFWFDVGEWMGLRFILLKDNAIKLVGQNFVLNQDLHYTQKLKV